MLHLTARQPTDPDTTPSWLQAEPLSEAGPLIPSTIPTGCSQQLRGIDVEHGLPSTTQACSITDADQAEPASVGQKMQQVSAAPPVHVPGVTSSTEPADGDFRIKAGTHLPPQQQTRVASPEAPCTLAQHAEQEQQKRLPGTRVDQQVLHHLLKQASPEGAEPVSLQQPPQ